MKMASEQLLGAQSINSESFFKKTYGHLTPWEDVLNSCTKSVRHICTLSMPFLPTVESLLVAIAY